jgi:hypothetical protein
MFFRRPRPHIPTFAERVDILSKAGFATERLPDGRVRVSKKGSAAIIGDEGKNQPDIERAGLWINGEIATLLNRGFQMFWETPSGKVFPAQAEQLHALHDFEADVKEALDLTDLYNTSLGTTSRKHMYDRVWQRDTGRQPKPWDRREHRIAPPETKADNYPA